MKTAILILMAIIGFVFNGGAQQPPQHQVKVIEPFRLEISDTRTTNVIFPYAIISVDRGSKDVLTQKASGVENILQLKAASDSFTETNLSVVTADGRLSSFILTFATQPKVLNFSLAQSSLQEGKIFLSPEKINEQEVKAYARAAMIDEKRVKRISDKKSEIELQLTGFFVHEDIMYARIVVLNFSNIGYDIDQLRFFVRDQKKPKRTTSQEIEISPVYIEGATGKIPGKVGWNFVYALPKFTFPDQKYLAIQLMEKNGGRHLSLKVKNKTIINCTVLEKPAEQVDRESIINL